MSTPDPGPYRDVAAGMDPVEFHRALYAGTIARFTDLAAMHDLVALTRDFVESRSAPHPPVAIHRHRSPAELAEFCAGCIRDYGRSSEVKLAWRRLFESIGLDAAAVGRDRLRLRFQPPVDDMPGSTWNLSTATVGFHRDTWGTNLYAQVNWWAPIYPLSEGRTMAFFPTLWDVAVPNTSADFDMAEAMRRVRERGPDLTAADVVPQAVRPVDPAAAMPALLDPGSVLAFSGQHAHAGVRNRTGLTRISVETRTLLIDDHVRQRGAANVDGAARWMTPGMFRRLSDGVRVSDLLQCAALEPYRRPAGA